MGIGAKASTIMLGVWAITTYVISGFQGERNDFRIPAPSPSFLALLALALLAMVSALWAKDWEWAIKSGAVLACILLLGHLLRVGLERLPTPAAILCGGWLVIGICAGCLLMMIELYTNFGLLRWVMAAFPEIRPNRNSMMVVEGNQVEILDRSIGNWSVAGLNLLFWPSLLILTNISTSQWVKPLCLGLIVCVGAITFGSEHQTSQLAFVASSVVFVLFLYFGRIMRGMSLALFVALVVGVVPLSQYAYHDLKLQNARWAQFTLQERFKIWGNSADHVRKNLWLGIGAHNTTVEHTDAIDPAKVPSAKLQPHHPHNIVLQVWLELGLVGAGLLLAAGLLALRDFKRMTPSAAPYGYAAAATAVIQSIATWNLWHDWLLSAFMITLASISLGNRLARASADPATPRFTDIWLPFGAQKTPAIHT